MYLAIDQQNEKYLGIAVGSKVGKQGKHSAQHKIIALGTSQLACSIDH